MKNDTYDHWKLLQVTADLEIPRPYAAGIVEGLWRRVARYAPSGDVTFLTGEILASWLAMPLDMGAPALVALERAQLLERLEDGRLVVHDWPAHAEDQVHLALARRGELFADGTRPNLRRLSSGERAQVAAMYDAMEEKRKAEGGRRNGEKNGKATKAPRNGVAVPHDDVAVPRKKRTSLSLSLSLSPEEEKTPPNPPQAGGGACGGGNGSVKVTSEPVSAPEVVEQAPSPSSLPEAERIRAADSVTAFNAVYAAYPRPRQKGKARGWKSWERHRQGGRLPPLRELLGALAAQVRSREWGEKGGQYVPHFSTWIEGARWEDSVAVGGYSADQDMEV